MAGTNLRLVVAATLTTLTNALLQPLLSTIATIPELSTFSSVINATGGTQPNPSLEERFNSALDGRNYTVLAPTNDAFAKISPPLVKALTAASSYPILEAIIRTHVAEGLFTSTDIVSASPIESIEGFLLSSVVTGGENKITLVNDQSQIIAVDTLASNGVIHQIDQVLNPFTAYFGITNSTTAPRTTDTDGTVADILLTDDRLSTVRDILQALSPDLIGNRLALSRPDGLPQIFAAPSNDAFSVLPASAATTSVAPFNQPLSFQLFSFGLLDINTRLADLNHSTGSVNVGNVFTRIGATVTQTEEGVVVLNNAAVQEEICVSNGCVWFIDRVLDPLYLAFGPLDRT